MTKKPEIVPAGTKCRVLEGDEVSTGQWYMVRWSEGERRLACVTKIGSNYVGLHAVPSGEIRIHFDDFWKECELAEDAEAVIQQNIRRAKAEVMALMAEVQAITERLSLTGGPALGGGEATALATIGKDVPADRHKAALTLAKEKTLPELFRKIKDANEEVADWMTATVIPLRATAEEMKGVIGVIEGRIFNVELYAGLTEQVVMVKDGDPAGVAERVHLMQRRCYMDEECLSQYETGGMELKDIKAFDRWLGRQKNMDRILPHPKCIVSFQVRREKKERHADSLTGLINMFYEEQGDKLTFLYIRNGDRLYRMRTALEFGEKLFPDMDGRTGGNDKLWVKMWNGRPAEDGFISEAEYLEKKAEFDQKEAERLLAWKRAKKGDKWHHQFRTHSDVDEYVPYDQKSVYYDDISGKLQKDMEKHNRIALIVQGLLDRSEVLHPHPQWKIWTGEGFEQALVLEYDGSRALTSGDAPDFEGYRARLNVLIRPGTVTVGQERAWELHEGEKNRRRIESDWRRKGEQFIPETHRPYGNPGPGKLARVVQATKTGRLTYEWTRRGQNDWLGRGSRFPVSITISSSRVLNVDAYKPGDFRIFFDDPRTRADYLKWARLLLEAEEYHAGNRTVGPGEDDQ